jgi:hypothetical protein
MNMNKDRKLDTPGLPLPTAACVYRDEVLP